MNIEEMRRVAEAATPGPWHACGQERGGCVCLQVWSKSADTHVHTVAKHGDDQEGACLVPEEGAKRNAIYCATFNPAVVLGLIEVCEWVEDGDLLSAMEALEDVKKALVGAGRGVK